MLSILHKDDGSPMVRYQNSRYNAQGEAYIKIVLYRGRLCQPAILDVQGIHVILHGSNTDLVISLQSAWTLRLWVEVFPVQYSLVIYDFGGVECI